MFRIFIAFCLLFFSFTASSQLSTVDNQYIADWNGLKNPGFENGIAGWTKTGSSTFATTTSSGWGERSLQWDPSAASEELTGTGFTPKAALQESGNCLVSMWYKWSASATTGDIEMVVEDSGSDEIVNVDLEPSATWIKTAAQFNCPSSGLIQFKLKSTTNAASITIDNVWLGTATYIYSTPTVDWTTYTSDPSINAGFGTLSSENFQWSRVGDTMSIRGYATTGSVSATEGRLALPNGLTIGGEGSGTTAVGRAWRDTSSTLSSIVLATKDDGYLNFALHTSGAASSPVTPANGNAWISASQRFVIKADNIPIAEWTGSANYANSQVEFASNSDTSDAADTTSFVYSATGSDFPGTLTDRRQKRVSFATAIQQTDSLVFEADLYGNGNFTPLPVIGAGSNDIAVGDRNTNVGIVLEHIDGNDTNIDVEFQRYRYGGSTDWGTLPADAKWRIRKSASPSPVGYPPTEFQIVKLYQDASYDGVLGNLSGTTGNSAFKFTAPDSGKKFQVKIQISGSFTTGATQNQAKVFIRQGSTNLAFLSYRDSVNTANREFTYTAKTPPFVSDGSDVEFYVSYLQGTIRGNDTLEESWALIELLPNHIEVNKW